MPEDRVIYFAFDSDNLTPEAKSALKELMEEWKQRRELTLYLEGHADEIGGDDYNMALSRRRAESVKHFLESNGFEGLSYKVEARGESDPVSQKQAQNRCVELYFRSGVRQEME